MCLTYTARATVVLAGPLTIRFLKPPFRVKLPLPRETCTEFKTNGSKCSIPKSGMPIFNETKKSFVQLVAKKSFQCESFSHCFQGFFRNTKHLSYPTEYSCQSFGHVLKNASLESLENWKSLTSCQHREHAFKHFSKAIIFRGI